MRDKPVREGLTLEPIGFARTPFPDRASAPRQPARARDVRGTLELVPDGRFEHALSDLSSFPFIWVLFWFHLSSGWKGKVRPPRSPTRRGVFATRSPHRPNPIGMSVLALERIDGLTLHVRGLDLVDGTPILDIKPYLAYTDAIIGAGHGWLEADESASRPDPQPPLAVEATERASAQFEFLRARGVDLWPRVTEVLSSGATPHPYRRIQRDGDGFRLAVQEWRVRFRIDAETVTVEAVTSGYRAKELRSAGPELDLHRAFEERFGASAG